MALNMTGEIKGDKLVITIDVSPKTIAEAGPSKSGKTKLIASSKGFVQFGNVGVSLNATV